MFLVVFLAVSSIWAMLSALLCLANIDILQDPTVSSQKGFISKLLGFPHCTHISYHFLPAVEFIISFLPEYEKTLTTLLYISVWREIFWSSHWIVHMIWCNYSGKKYKQNMSPLWWVYLWVNEMMYVFSSCYLPLAYPLGFWDIFNTHVIFFSKKISSSNLKNNKNRSRPNLQIEIIFSFKNKVKMTFGYFSMEWGWWLKSAYLHKIFKLFGSNLNTFKLK